MIARQCPAEHRQRLVDLIGESMAINWIKLNGLTGMSALIADAGMVDPMVAMVERGSPMLPPDLRNYWLSWLYHTRGDTDLAEQLFAEVDLRYVQGRFHPLQ